MVALLALGAVGLFLVATPAPVQAVLNGGGGGGGACQEACLTLSPTDGPAGTSVSVTGTLFTEGAPVTAFTFGGTTPAVQTCTSQTTALYTGSFNCTFTVPNDPAAAYDVDATVNSQTGIASFTITTSTTTTTTTTATTTSPTTTVTTTSITTTATAGVTSTGISCTPSIVAVEVPTTCTATVTDTSGSPTTPTGTVTFFTDNGLSTQFGSTTCSLSQVSAVAASCYVTYTPALGSEGTHDITGTYVPDESHTGSSSSFALTVTQRSTSTAVSCSPSSVVVGAPTTCTATVTDTDAGTQSAPTFDVLFLTSGNGAFTGASGSSFISFYGYNGCALNPIDSSHSSCSVTYTPASGDEGSVIVFPIYLGDTDHGYSYGFATGSEYYTISVVAASPTITTALSNSGTITIGGSATDTATLTGGFNPTGSITYSVFTDSGCTSSVPLGSAAGEYTPDAVSASGNGVQPASTAFTPASAGAYYWNAAYSGDSNNNGVTSSCELLTVNQGTSSVVTTLVGATQDGGVALGSSVGDSATVTFTPSGFAASGSVTFNFYSGSCSSGALEYTDNGVALGGTPTAQGPLAAGTYSWDAQYITGNKDNYQTSLVSSCESFTVQPASLTISTAVSPSTTPALGASVSDTATATAGEVSGFTPSGTLTITLYSGSGCAGLVISTQTGVALGTPSSPQTTLATGPYSYEASAYTGDSNYVGSGYGCENFAVQQARSSTSSLVQPSSSVLLGTSTHDTSMIGGTVTGFTPTGTVTYSFYGSAACGGTPTSHTVAMSGGTVPQSSSQKLPPGQYSYSASYSGDSNYVGSTSGCEPLAVQTPSTTVLVCLPPNGVVGVPESCTATVVNNDVLYFTRAIGTVTFTGTLPPGMPTSCALGGGVGILSSCTVSWTAAAGTEGNYHISVSYSGDATHASSSTGGGLTIAKRGVSVSLSCSSPYRHNTPTTCTVTVTDTSLGTPITPTGAVTFSSSGPGAFSSPTCTLAGSGATSSCHVTFTPTSKGSYTITASYGGDTDHAAGARSTSFKVT